MRANGQQGVLPPLVSGQSLGGGGQNNNSALAHFFMFKTKIDQGQGSKIGTGALKKHIGPQNLSNN